MSASGRDLRQIPLVRQLLDDPEVRWIRRPVDQTWSYNRLTSSALGWYPWRTDLFVGVRSMTQRWLDHPDADLRELNEGDFLITELLFAVHDHLHAWAARTLAALAPERQFGFGRLDADTIETHVFFLLLTEAVATVGLDYWYLCTTDLNRVVDLGTAREALTTDYREVHLDEYRRSAPGLTVQSVDFFTRWAQFYCTGHLMGFGGPDALRTSPLLLRWLKKELLYGKKQRVSARKWLEHLAGGDIYPTGFDRDAPVSCGARWQRDLIAALGERLWARVKLDRPDPTPPALSEATWAAPERGPINFNLTNAAALPDLAEAIRARGLVPGSFHHLFSQLVSALPFEEHHARLRPELAAIEREGSVERLLALTTHHPQLAGEPSRRDLLFFS